MDIQSIISIIIVGIAAVLAIRFLAQKFIPKRDRGENCTDTSACKGCPISEACHNKEKSA